MVKIFCYKCGTQIDHTVSFSFNCGNQINIAHNTPVSNTKKAYT